LPQLAAGPADLDHQQAAEHLAECVRCQAEVAAYRRILRQLRLLRNDVMEPPPGALTAVLAALEAAAAEQASGATWVVRAAYVGGITAATAAVGAAGVLVWMSRRRVALSAAS
jgi:hypothetical protein